MWGIPHTLRTLLILQFFELFENFGDFIWLEYCLNRFITLRRWSNDLRKKNTKKLGRVQRMWGILTFFVPSHFFTSLNFLKILGTWYCLDIVQICSLHIRGGQMISKKNQNPKILKNYKEYEECYKSSHSSYPSHSPVFELFKYFGDFIWFGYYLNRFITLRR